eukprot:765713-Hanusia_phi.AAC.11
MQGRPAIDDIEKGNKVAALLQECQNLFESSSGSRVSALIAQFEACKDQFSNILLKFQQGSQLLKAALESHASFEHKTSELQEFLLESSYSDSMPWIVVADRSASCTLCDPYSLISLSRYLNEFEMIFAEEENAIPREGENIPFEASFSSSSSSSSSSFPSFPSFLSFSPPFLTSRRHCFLTSPPSVSSLRRLDVKRLLTLEKELVVHREEVASLKLVAACLSSLPVRPNEILPQEKVGETLSELERLLGKFDKNLSAKQTIKLVVEILRGRQRRAREKTSAEYDEDWFEDSDEGGRMQEISLVSHGALMGGEQQREQDVSVDGGEGMLLEAGRRNIKLDSSSGSELSEEVEDDDILEEV